MWKAQGVDELSGLDEAKSEVVRQCLDAAVNGPFFDDWEFQTLMGLERDTVAEILAAWPRVEGIEGWDYGINNAMLNLLAYPHGQEQRWPDFIKASQSEVQAILELWRSAHFGESNPA